MPAFRFYECMVFDNPLRDALLVEPVGEKGQLVAGELPVPQGPGLGVEVDRAMLRRLRAN
jgi:galactonate dehydratase